MPQTSAAKPLSHAGMIAALAGAAWSIAAQPAHAQTAPAAQVDWGVQVAPGECTLTGTPAGPAPVRVSLQTLPGSDTYRLSLVGETVPRAPAGYVPVTITLGPDRRIDRNARGGQIAGFGNAILIGGLEREHVTALAAAGSVGLEGRYKVAPIALSRTRAALRALDDCARDQLIEWGADAGQFQPGGKLPVALIPRDDWLSKEQLIRLAPKGHDALEAVFRVAIASDGSIDGCSAVGPAPDAKVQKAACDAVLTRRLFTPAADPAGTPVRGVALFEISLFVTRSVSR